MSDKFFPEPDYQIAQAAVERFVSRFEPSYRRLLYHAALPLVLTPELLSYLRTEFLQREVPWVAEVDLLLSDLCQPAGYELYTMDSAVRAYLLREMKQDPNLGPQRMEDVARRLIHYVRHLSKSNTFLDAQELQAQQWAAMVYIEEQQEVAVQEIQTAFENVTTTREETGILQISDTNEVARLAHITQELAPGLEQHPDLIDYAARVTHLLMAGDSIPGIQVSPKKEEDQYSPKPSTDDDFYVIYESRMRELLTRIGQTHPRYEEALAYQRHLSENLQHTRTRGDSQDNRAERAKIIYQLNRFSLNVLGIAFNDLVQAPRVKVAEDFYIIYEARMRDLLTKIEQTHPDYSEALVYQHRLSENLQRTRTEGDSEDNRAERAEIIYQLNRFSLNVLGIAFNDLVQAPRTEATNDPYMVYEDCMRELLTRIGQTHPHYNETLVYQHRLSENLQGIRSYGDSTELRLNLAQIIDQLNKLSLDILGNAFVDLAQAPDVNKPPISLLSTDDELYIVYEARMRELLVRLGRNHPRYSEAISYQQRLMENLTRTRLFGNTTEGQVERFRIFAQLNELSLNELDIAFCDLVQAPEIAKTALLQARRVLAILEEQAVLYKSSTIPTSLQTQLEYQRKEVARLEAQLTRSSDVETPFPNPFTDTLMIRDPSRFIGRKAELRRLRKLLQQGSVALIGEPKIGKSSLVYRLIQEWQGQVIGPLDCQSFEDLADFYEELAGLLNVDPDKWRTLRKVLNNTSILLVLDEFDAAPGFGLTAGEMGRFRAVAQSNPDFRMIIVCRSSPDKILPSGVGSPFYNILSSFILASLNNAEALTLLNHPWSPEAPHFDDATIDQLMALADNHPFKLQRAAYHCYEALRDPAYDWRAAYKQDIAQMLTPNPQTSEALIDQQRYALAAQKEVLGMAIKRYVEQQQATDAEIDVEGLSQVMLRSLASAQNQKTTTIEQHIVWQDVVVTAINAWIDQQRDIEAEVDLEEAARIMHLLELEEDIHLRREVAVKIIETCVKQRQENGLEIIPEEAVSIVHLLNLEDDVTFRSEFIGTIISAHISQQQANEVEIESERLIQTMRSLGIKDEAEMLKAVQRIQDESSRTKVLTALVPHFSEQLLPEVLTTIRMIEDTEKRMRSLIALLPYLASEARERILMKILSEAQAIEDESTQIEILAELAPYLTDDMRAMYQPSVATSIIDLETQRAQLTEEYNAIFAQLDRELRREERKRLRNRLTALQREIQEIDAQFDVQVAPEFTFIPAGTFLMGSDPKAKEDKAANNNEQPQHEIYLPIYYIAKTPVTNAQYMAFVRATGYQIPAHWQAGNPPRGKEDHPVVNVSWYDAIAYCKWLAQITGKPYRLPTEAEWEKAARGTDGRIYPWGNQISSKTLCNFNNNIGDTTPVGSYSPQGDSPYGCMDMAGNVWEWTNSLFRSYPYQSDDGREDGEVNSPRVMRGGAFINLPEFVRCASRSGYDPSSRHQYNGFRLAMSETEAQESLVSSTLTEPMLSSVSSNTSLTLTWLHLSDLHFHESRNHDERIILQALLSDIAERTERDGLHPDFIAVTGDLASSGKPEEYMLVRGFFDDLLSVVNLPRERLFVVPGNHDIDRSLVSNDIKVMTESLLDRDKTNAILSDTRELKSIMQPFKGYADFVNDYFDGYITFSSKQYFYVHSFIWSGPRVMVMGLNSAWACRTDNDMTPGVLLGERQTRSALELAKSGDIKIALLHHPLEALREFDQNTSAAMLLSDCDFILHGHLHRSMATTLSRIDTNAMIIGSDACYETRQCPNTYRTHLN